MQDSSNFEISACRSVGSEWIDALACLCQDVRHTPPQGEIHLEE